LAVKLAVGGRPPTVLRLVRASPAIPANRQGRIRVFADEGEPVRTLLAHLLAARRVEPAIAGDAPVGDLGRVVRGFDSDVSPALGLVP
jgi:hypothetical protein